MTFYISGAKCLSSLLSSDISQLKHALCCQCSVSLHNNFIFDKYLPYFETLDTVYYHIFVKMIILLQKLLHWYLK